MNARADLSVAELDQLTHYIVEHHHRYVREACPMITARLDELVAERVDEHPELARVRDVFHELRDELLSHMLKEENVLFPFIEDLARASRMGRRAPASPFGTIQNPVRVMESDHQLAGDLTARLRSLTHEYAAPDTESAAWHACYLDLAEFERDLHAHIDLENNVLFPRAVELENRLS